MVYSSVLIARMVMDLTPSASKWIFCYFHTMEPLNGARSFNIHHRDLPMVLFNSKLNSAHF